MKSVLICASLLLTASLSTITIADSTEDKLKAAMAADVRTQAEKNRDRNRRPIQTLEFFGLKDDMKILELIPGGGWYTKLLAPTVAENGEYHASIFTDRIKERVAGQPGFEKISILEVESNIRRPEGSRLRTMDNFSFPEKGFDMVLTFRNYHNFDEQGRRAMNKASFEALKSGGVYAVVDHTRRHMQNTNDENRRRIDPVLAIKEIREAGFKFVDYSRLHYKLDDELRYEVGRRSVTGNTDRFTLKFVKP